MRHVPEKVIFVFGSNLAGRHGKGAAKYAADHYGAEYGVGYGPTGYAYAIATKDEQLNPLPWEQVARNVITFVEFAKARPDWLFLLTPVGTGLAGHSKRNLWELLHSAGIPSNVTLTSSWIR